MSEFVKRHNAFSLNTTPPRVQEFAMDLEQKIAYVPERLTQWYAANESVRHLWAVEEPTR